MPLYNLMREYEERRQALIDQLKSNPSMDPAVQHQIYGAIKEIENFLKTIEFQIANKQAQHIGIDLSRDRPRPLVEKTKRLAGKVTSGAKKVGGTVKLGAKKVAAVPKRYIARRREKRALKQEIKRELLRRLQQNAASTGALPRDVQTDLHSEQALPEMPVGGELSPEFSGTSKRNDIEEPRDQMPKRVPKVKKAVKAGKKPAGKAALKKTKKVAKTGKKAARKPKKR